MALAEARHKLDPSDVVSLDAIVRAMYDVISGPAGKARDWDRFRHLYADGARLMPVISLTNEAPRVRWLSPEEYICRVEPIFAREDFWEREVDRQSETFGHVAHVLSSYESLRAQNGAPFERGKNSIQFFNDGRRWWIVNVMWNSSRSE